jgi:hypothetical protein
MVLAQKLEALVPGATLSRLVLVQRSAAVDTQAGMPPGIDLAVASDRESRRYYDEGWNEEVQRCG